MRFVVGLDGGGSKLLCVIADETGQMVASSIGGPTNSNFNTPEEIHLSISTAISDALAKYNTEKKDVTIVYGAMPIERELASSAIMKSLHESASIRLCSEFTLSLFGAVQEDFGALVQAGTGSFATIRTAFAEKTVDGWGTIIGDEGSGYYIGRKALIACARMEDGRGHYTALLEKILVHLKQADTRILAQWIYRTPVGKQRTLIASLCPIVGKCAVDGDQVAIDILNDAADCLALQAITVLNMPGVEDSFPLSVAGGVWKTYPMLFKRFATMVQQKCPHVRIMQPLFEPVIGGVLLGLRDLGFPLKERIPELRKYYSAFALSPELFK